MHRTCAQKPQTSASHCSGHFQMRPFGLWAHLAGAQQWPLLARLRAFKSSQSRWNTDCIEKKQVFGGSGLSQSAASKRFFGVCAEYAIAWSCSEMW